ncbi:spondin-1-like [Battus philenor]|uniref:spondin-1-like n=1 Tax=Battus philenor TaxID=42288 RepID=UPI0035D08C65
MDHLLEALILFMVCKICLCEDILCDRRPLGTTTDPLPPDSRFKIEIIGVTDKYIPTRQYTIRLSATDGTSTFIAFTIWARGDIKPHDKNPQKTAYLDAGFVFPSPNSETTPNKKCNNSVVQTDLTPKTSVEAHWKAPKKENKCVTINAVVAVKRDVWYRQDGPLSKRVCEDRRNVLDMQPTKNDNCNATEDARYLLTFEGMWSYNTHPKMYPDSEDLARFSDVVGASHNSKINVFKYNSEASEGLKRLAEQGNTTQLEIEIMKQLGRNVRTIIKAVAPLKTNTQTTSMFRVTRDHHLVSLVTALIPSPDWFLGVSNMELCDVRTGTWANNLTLNLYPMDAGTDSGKKFDSSNDETMPPQPISTAVINPSVPKEEIRPFARLQFDLIRTYRRTSNTETNVEVTESEVEETEEEPTTSATTTQAQEINVETGSEESDSNCPMSGWDNWLSCEGECIDNKIEGYQIRFRHHLVNNQPVDLFGPLSKRIPKECIEKYSVNELRACKDECDEEPEGQ